MPSSPFSRAASSICFARAGERIRDAQTRRRASRSLPAACAVRQRYAAQIVAIEIEQVENEIDHRRDCATGARWSWGRYWRCAAESGGIARRPWHRARRFRHPEWPARAASWWGIAESSGYCRSQRLPVRDCRRTISFSMKARARTPSHFTSKSQSSPRGRHRAETCAIIGSMAAGIRRLARALQGQPGSTVFF